MRIAKIKINDKEKYLGSYYNHKRDIDKFIKDIGEIDDNEIIVSYGIIDGEYLLELSRIKNKVFKIIVFEKDETLIKNILNDEYYNNIFKDERIRIFRYDEEKIEDILSNELNELNIYNTRVFNNDILLEYNNKEMISISKILRKFININDINNYTLDYFSERWFECFIKNFKYALNSTFLEDIKNKFKNKPAIILSAGPSLEKKYRTY